MAIILAVSGGRRYRNAKHVYATLDEIHAKRGVRLLIEGECPVEDGGADELARCWAIHKEVNYLGVPPKVKKFGWPAAGPLRNREMAKLKPDTWVFFPGGNGTADARSIAAEFGIEIIDAPDLAHLV